MEDTYYWEIWMDLKIFLHQNTCLILFPTCSLEYPHINLHKQLPSDIKNEFTIIEIGKERTMLYKVSTLNKNESILFGDNARLG